MERRPRRKKSSGGGDEADDYQSSFTAGGDGATTVAPTEYTRNPDYRSTYITDDAATVFSGVTGIDAERKTKRKTSRPSVAVDDYKSSYTAGGDGATTVAPTEYTRNPDYKSTYITDDAATVFSGVTGIDAERKTKRKTSRPSVAVDDYKSSYTADGATTAAPTEYTRNPDYKSTYITEEAATVYSGVTKIDEERKTKRKKSRPVAVDDYKSSYTAGGDATTVAPTEYTRNPDYKSTYITDDAATVFSGVTGIDAERKTKRKTSRPSVAVDDYKSSYTASGDGATTVAPTEYTRNPDYKSTYITDEAATVFSGVTGIDGAETATVYTRQDGYNDTATVYTRQDDTGTVYTSQDAGTVYTRQDGYDDTATAYTRQDDNGTVYTRQDGYKDDIVTVLIDDTTIYTDPGRDETKDGTNTEKSTQKRKHSKSKISSRSTDYQSTFTDGMDGAETATRSVYFGGGETTVEFQSTYHEDDATVFSALTGASTMITGQGGPVVATQPDNATVYIGNQLLSDHLSIMNYGDDYASEALSVTDGFDAMSDYQSMYSGGLDIAALSDFQSHYAESILPDYKSTFSPDAAAKALQSALALSTMPLSTAAAKSGKVKRRERCIKVAYAVMGITTVLFGVCMYFVITTTTSEVSTSVLLANLKAAIDEFNQLHSQILIEKERAENIFQQISSANASLQENLNSFKAEIEEIVQIVARITSTGLSPEVPILSCRYLPVYYPSGFYWIRARNGSSLRVYCDMTFSCNGLTGGWTRIVERNFQEDGEPCPPPLILLTSSVDTRSCAPEAAIQGCETLVLFDTGIEYTEVCGTLIAYQIGHPDAFEFQQDTPINETYVDGVNLHYGTSPPRHIWTFAAASDEASAVPMTYRCPCMAGGHLPESRPPAFVGNNYFCDTASDVNHTIGGRFHSFDPLWDGAGCGVHNQCCTFNNPPIFYRHLPQFTTEDMTLSVCINRPSTIGSENVGIRNYAIYVS